jgi:ribosomal protein L15
MKVHDLKPAPGSTKARRRVGRGIAGKGGKTAGRGTKGQGARDNIKPGFEGGQLPLKQRIPKLKGFKNPFRVEYNVINLDTLEGFEGDVVTPETLRAGPGAQARPRQGARPGRADPPAQRLRPRLLPPRRCRHRGGRRPDRGHPPPVRPRPAAGQGQRAHQPLRISATPRGPLRLADRYAGRRVLRPSSHLGRRGR